MPRRRALGAAALLLLGTVLLYFLPRFFPAAEPGPSRPAPAPTPPAAARPAGSAIASRPSASSDFPLAAALLAPGGDIHADLRAVADLLDAFRSNFPREGNPVGDNVEITAALTGRNRLHLVLIPPGHPALNAAGELCDRWGTPFFFHAESATRMGLRSAGPDRRLWTGDDVIFEP
jgi:hypothetical protein